MIVLMDRRLGGGLLLAASVALTACLPSGSAGTLPPTLTVEQVGGLQVAMQNGIPVPSFDWQPRPRVDLDGRWRVERVELDAAVTMTDRATSLATIESDAQGRHAADYDDSTWGTVAVPGTFNPPPEGTEGGAWYRRAFDVPRAWSGRAVTLRFGSANYVADVWVNGTWVGYHEGGMTPFAFDLGHVVRPGSANVIAVRVHAIPLGTRVDILPWGLIDWWNYGGLTGPVWLEAAPPVHVARADVVPHLDAVDLEILVAHAGQVAGGPAGEIPGEGVPSAMSVTATILPATVTPGNLLDPDPRALVPDAASPLVTSRTEREAPPPGALDVVALSIGFAGADLWSPSAPALYVLRVDLRSGGEPLDAREARRTDTFWTTFGIRHVSVDPDGPRVRLNGTPAFFRGVGLHAESLAFDPDGRLVSGTPAQRLGEVLNELRDADAVGANLVRAGHQPADPSLLMLADRLGFAVWEEIPIYHATPFIFERIMRRGIPQQMLREMALRDMNRPSVLFHGFANESTGEEERTRALAELHEVDRSIDGTRLTGQAAYGWNPSDPTHAPLDVVGFTSYYGVFYGDDARADTAEALRVAHATHPTKPLMILEFGRWADWAADEARQRVVFEETYEAIAAVRADRPGGYVSGATWWTLHDFATQISGIGVEHFGLYRADGSLRPAGEVAADTFNAPAGEGSELALEPEIVRPQTEPAPASRDWALVWYLAYALVIVVAFIGASVVVLTRFGGRALGRAP